MGLPVSITKIIIYDNRDTDDFYGGRDQIQIWLSDDNVTYSFYQEYTDPARTGGVCELVFSVPQLSRYFKLFCSEDVDGLWVDVGNSYQCVELECWGLEILPCLKGTVKEKGVAVERTLRSYIRSTGQLYTSSASAPDGTFSLDAPDDTTEMYVIALDDDVGEQYNALIFDRVVGVFDE
ncbi:hypothetical protein ES703_112105 [subsurface metagenome]